MPKSIRRVHDAAFKTKVVVEALKGAKTLAQLARQPGQSEFGIHAQQITDRNGGPVDGRHSTEYLLFSRLERPKLG
jgi:transposase-like protein